MLMHRQHLLLFTFICLFLLAFAAACGDNGAILNAQTGTPVTTQNIATGTSQPALTSTGASLNASCPTAGTGRAAVMPALRLGTRQEIVYYHNIDNQMALD